MPIAYALAGGLVLLFALLLPPGVWAKNMLFPVKASAAQCSAGALGEAQRTASLAVPVLSRGRCSVAAMTTHKLLSDTSGEISATKRVSLVKNISKKLDGCSHCNLSGEGLFPWLFTTQAKEWLGESWGGEPYWSPKDLKKAIDVHKIVVVALRSDVIWRHAKHCQSVKFLEQWNGVGGDHFVVIFAVEGSLEDDTLGYWIADGGIPTIGDDGSGHDGQQNGAVYFVDAKTIHEAISEGQFSLFAPVIYYEN